MPNYHSEIFVDSVGGQDVAHKERRFLLIPISGSVIGPEEGVALSLTPEPIDTFCEASGWDAEVCRDLADLDLGKSLIAFDGVGQIQSIVRVL